MRKIVLFFAMLLFLSSCVTRKQLTYLQEDENAPVEYYKLSRSKYKVQPNDILNISVKSLEPEASDIFNSVDTRNLNPNLGDITFYINGFTVDPSGNIEVPIAGKIPVIGKDVDEIKLILEQKLGDYFKDGAIYVNVQLAGIRFSVVGDVNRAGRYVIYQNQVNVFEALAAAGDITLVGDRTKVMILRQNDQGVKTIKLDLTDSRVIEDPYYFIQPNDVINVQPLSQKSLGIGTTGFQSFTSIFGVLVSTITLIIAINSLN